MGRASFIPSAESMRVTEPPSEMSGCGYSSASRTVPVLGLTGSLCQKPWQQGQGERADVRVATGGPADTQQEPPISHPQI